MRTPRFAFRAALAVVAAIGVTGTAVEASASTPQAASSVICGDPPVHLITGETGSCTYYPTSKYGSLDTTGVVAAQVVCAGGGEAQTVSTGGSTHKTFQRAVNSNALPCVLEYVGAGNFSISAT